MRWRVALYTVVSVAILCASALSPARERPALASDDGYVLVKIVDSSETAPGTGGQPFATLGSPTLNNHGDIAFQARYQIDGFDKWGVFLRTPSGLTAVALQDGEAPAEVGGTFGQPSGAVINDDQQVAFLSAINSGNTTKGVFLWTAGATTKVAALGDSVPSVGTLDGIGGSCGEGISIDEAGAVAFEGVDFIFPYEQNAIIVGSDQGFKVPVVQDPFDGNSFTKFNLRREGLNDINGVSYWATKGGSPGVGLWSDGGSPIVQEGVTAPGTGGGTFGDFGNGALCSGRGIGPALNVHGDIAFYEDNIQGGAVTEGIFLHPAGGPTAAVALPGQVAPGTGGGVFGGFRGLPSLNDNGDIAFRASSSGGQGMFVVSGGSVSAVAIAGEAAPGTGGGTLSFLLGDYPVINNVGEVVFRANVAGGNAGEAIFLALPRKGDHDGDGLTNAYEADESLPCHDPLVDEGPDPDNDGADTLTEAAIGADPCDPDTDADGCLDGVELGSDETAGGLRDPLNPWDLYDTAKPKDMRVDLPNDILGVLLRWSSNPALPYDANYDRGPTTGPHPWNMTAPDGTIDLPNDILGVLFQYQHDCRPPP